jgi:uncharacterized protein (PEP-CTERM system associated)
MRLALFLPLLLLAAMPAQARDRTTQITPYIEVQEVLDADLSGPGSGQTLTYTTVAAGIDASVQTQRVQATIDYRYEHRFPNDNKLGNEDVHNGLGRVQLQVLPGALTLEAGAIATRAREDIRGAAPNTYIGDPKNVSQVYGAYVGPTLATHAGALNINATAQAGYVKVEDKQNTALAPGQPVLDSFDSSKMLNATASVGMASGLLPFGWTVSGGYEREDADQLDQRYEGKYARADVTLPVAPTLALTAGVGYENIKASQRDALRNADGTPVVDNGGRFVTDPASPRQLAFHTDGLIYDGGVIWKPNRRVTLEARGGYRYGGTYYEGSLSYQINRASGLQVGVYNRIDSFGRSLTRNLAALPTSFTVSRNPFADMLTGCVAGSAPATGTCFDDSFQSITTANFRSRGVFALYSVSHGPWSASLGGGYAERIYLAPEEGAGIFSLNGVKDQSYFAQGSLGRKLTRSSGIDLSLYADWYQSGIPGSRDVTSYGATAAYYHTFGDRLSANATIGVFGYDQNGFETDITGTALVGMRYQF